jgi:transposase
MSMRKPYPSDLTDEQWELLEPVITAWKARHPSVSGHQGKYAMREIVNAILYQNRTGCQWEFLPHDMPPPGAVKYYFYLWRDEGTDQDIHDLLRWQLREKRKRLGPVWRIMPGGPSALNRCSAPLEKALGGAGGVRR